MTKPIIIAAVTLLLTACSSWHLTTADKAYDRMAYARAAEHYDQALISLAMSNDMAAHRDAMLRAADAHARLGHLEPAAGWYTKASAVRELDADAGFRYGQVLMAQGRRAEAGRQFIHVLAERPEDRAAQDLAASCEDVASLYADSTRFTVSELLIPGIATAFSAVPYSGGLVIAGEQAPGIKRQNPWNNMSFLDLYFVKTNTLVNWEEAKPLEGDVNGRYHEGPAVFSADAKTMYFTRSNYYKFKLQKGTGDVSHLKLFRAELDAQGRWGNIREFPYNGEDHSTGHAALSADGLTLYFASDRPGSVGGTDLWRSVNNGAGWGPPENLGPTVNTAGNELFPTVNGDALYFASTAHQNLGGLDIFVTHPESGEWAEPKNLGYPINTTHDDFALVMNTDGKGGYLSSNRSGVDRVHLFAQNEPVFTIDGRVVDASDSQFLPMVAATLTDLGTLKEVRMTTGSDGRFSFQLEADSRYELKVEKEGMLTESREVSTQGLATTTTILETFLMKRLELGKPMALTNIYFDYDDWSIRPDAAAWLNQLARFFNDNPQLVFEISAHTDCRGHELYNLVLSDARANSTVDYLIRAGVDPDRLISKGYGESMLVNHCADGVTCAEEEHQQNRRTEFKVVRDLASSVH